MVVKKKSSNVREDLFEYQDKKRHFDEIWIMRVRKVSFVVGVVAFLFFLVAFLAPYWLVYKDKSYRMNLGLFFSCIEVNGKTTCGTSGGKYSGMLMAAQIFSPIAIITLFVVVCCGIMVFFWPEQQRRRLLIIASAMSFISTFLMLLVIGMYLGYYSDKVASLHAAFYFGLFGLLVSPVAGILFFQDSRTQILAEKHLRNPPPSKDAFEEDMPKGFEKHRLIGKGFYPSSNDFAVVREPYNTKAPMATFLSATKSKFVNPWARSDNFEQEPLPTYEKPTTPSQIYVRNVSQKATGNGHEGRVRSKSEEAEYGYDNEIFSREVSEISTSSRVSDSKQGNDWIEPMFRTYNRVPTPIRSVSAEEKKVDFEL